MSCARSWLLGPKVRELNWDASTTRPVERSPIYLWGDRVFGDHSEVLTELRTVHAWDVVTTDPESREGQGHYLFPRENDASKHLFYLRSDDRPDRALLATKRVDESTWTTLAETIGLGQVKKHFLGQLYCHSVALDFDEGIAVYSEPTRDGYRVVLSDRFRGRQLDILEYEMDADAPPPTIWNWSDESRQTSDVRLFHLERHEAVVRSGAGDGESWQQGSERRFFRYVLDSGDLQPVSPEELRDTECPDGRPFRILLTDSEFLRIDDDGSQTRVWPL